MYPYVFSKWPRRYIDVVVNKTNVLAVVWLFAGKELHGHDGQRRCRDQVISQLRHNIF